MRSKVCRKGRWFWYCTEDNNASDWKDSWACGARSRSTWTTEEEAVRAGKTHSYRARKENCIGCHNKHDTVAMQVRMSRLRRSNG